jgi:hypothetical protein
MGGDASRRATHQEEDLGVLLPQPEGGQDVVEPVHEKHHFGSSSRDTARLVQTGVPAVSFTNLSWPPKENWGQPRFDCQLCSLTTNRFLLLSALHHQVAKRAACTTEDPTTQAFTHHRRGGRLTRLRVPYPRPEEERVRERHRRASLFLFVFGFLGVCVVSQPNRTTEWRRRRPRLCSRCRRGPPGDTDQSGVRLHAEQRSHHRSHHH